VAATAQETSFAGHGASTGRLSTAKVEIGGAEQSACNSSASLVCAALKRRRLSAVRINVEYR